jgi:hypothetical protein
MKDFKFFQKGTLNDPQMLDEITRATASFHTQTPEGVMGRRRLYHTDRDLYDRLNNPTNNNEMERYYYDHGLGRFETVRPTLNQEEVIRRINGGGTDVRLFQATRVTTVDPKWWMKIKMGLQELSIFFKSSPYGIMFIWASSTIGVILTIAKILNVY